MKYKRGSGIVVMIILAMISCKKEGHVLPRTAGRPLPIVTQSGGEHSPPNLPINNQEAEKLKPSRQTVPTVPIDVVDVELISRIFEDILSQGSSLRGSYFANGQFVFAHNIRRYIQNTYDLNCEKVFLYGDLTGISPHYDCCTWWNYDVACVLRGNDGVLYVIDPRLFTRVVSLDVWVESHTIPTLCRPQPSKAPIAELVSGEAFHPTDLQHTSYAVDSAYKRTDYMMSYYADSVGCNCHLY